MDDTARTSELVDRDQRDSGKDVAEAAGRTREASYREFLLTKSQYGLDGGFDPLWIPDWLFDFQKSLVSWAIRKGRAALFADCGLGKTPMQLVWAQNVVEHCNRPVLIVTPLAVGQQTQHEADKFGMQASVSRDGSIKSKLVITNYERLHYFKPADFAGVVADESSCIKNADSKTKSAIGEFMRTMEYRLLCTATAAPNDWHELGTSSDVLGYLGFRDMITTFFKMEQKGGATRWGITKYRFREHAKKHFWRWVCSWARACRRPSDIGYQDDRFQLPSMTVQETLVKRLNKRPGYLFELPAVTLEDQREERRATINERCERIAELVNHDRPAVVWCHLNPEGDKLEKIIPDAIQVSGRDTENSKEHKLREFSDGNARVIVIKPKIGAWGLNWQHCSHVTMFPSHSYEQYYQAVRRCWRFGQTNPVVVDIVTTEGEQSVIRNMQRKSDQTNEMFEELVRTMNDSLVLKSSDDFSNQEKVPSWL